jgi:hypothetical protein
VALLRGEISAATGTEPPAVQHAHEEEMMEDPEPTETEEELSSDPERQTEEDDMRGTTDPEEQEADS